MQKQIKKPLLLILGFLFPLMQIFAQIPQIIDSLEKLLPKTSENQRVDVLNELAWNYKYVDLDKGLKYAEESAVYARKINYAQGLAYAERNIGTYFFLMNNFIDSEVHLRQCIEISLKNDLPFQQAKALNILAIIYREKFDYPQAIQYHQDALEIYKKLNITQEIAGVYNNIAFIYDRIHETDKALEMHLMVLDIEKSTGNPEGIARTSSNLGYAYSQMNDYKKSIQYFDITIEASKKLGNNNFLASAYHGLGNVYGYLDNVDLSIENYIKAADINRATGNDIWLASNYVNLSESYVSKKDYIKALALIDTATLIYEKNDRKIELIMALVKKGKIDFMMGRTEAAEKLFRKSIGISDSVDVLLAKESYQELYLLEKSNGNYQDALLNYEKSVELSDSLEKVENNKALMEISTKYEVKQKDAENLHLKSLNALNERIILNQRHVFVGTTLFVVFLSVLIIVLFHGQKRLKLANLELSRKSDEISAQSAKLTELNATKDRLFSIIAHDLKNPFNSILGFSEIASQEVEKYNDHELSEVISYIHNSANNAYKLLENLLEWSRCQRGIIDFQPVWIDVKESLDELIGLSADQAKSKMISVINNIPSDFKIFADQNMFETMMRNLVGNAIKFTSQHGKVEVLATEVKGFVQIIVADSGVGMTTEKIEKLFRIDQNIITKGTSSEKGTGLGLILCKELIEKHQGSITVESAENKGSRFLLSFPIPSSNE